MVLLRLSLTAPAPPASFSAALNLEWPYFLRASHKLPHLSSILESFYIFHCDAQGSPSGRVTQPSACSLGSGGRDWRYWHVDRREFIQAGSSWSTWERRVGWYPASFSAWKLYDPGSQDSQLKSWNTRTKCHGRERRRVSAEKASPGSCQTLVNVTAPLISSFRPSLPFSSWSWPSSGASAACGCWTVLPLLDYYPECPPLFASDWSLPGKAVREKGGPWRNLSQPNCTARCRASQKKSVFLFDCSRYLLNMSCFKEKKETGREGGRAGEEEKAKEGGGR